MLQPSSKILEGGGGKDNSSQKAQELQQAKKEELIVLIPQPCWKSAHIHQLLGNAQTLLDRAVNEITQKSEESGMSDLLHAWRKWNFEQLTFNNLSREQQWKEE